VPPAVLTSGLSKSYGPTRALDEVDLRVEPGSVYGLVGPNGAGKSTLVSVLAGLRRPSAGEVTLGVERARMSVMPDTPRFDPWLTATEVVDLSENLNGHGQLVWSVPEGNWTLVRFARTAMAGHEYDVDVLDPAAVTGHFNRMGKRLLEDAGRATRETLTHFYSVSWEGAAPTWTGGLETQFQKYRGYSPRPYLPVLAGKTVTSQDVSERFLCDYYTTLGDLFRDNFYGQLQASCHEFGLK